MRKLILGAAVVAMAFIACAEKKSPDPVIGSWVMPIEGQPGQVQGIKIEKEGKASSINMATLIYKSWKQEGDNLYLAMKSIGNGMEIEGVDTFKIERVTSDSLILNSNNGYITRYVKQN